MTGATPAKTGTTTERYCLACGYSLRGLADPRCPECGRTFDPAKPRTYRRRAGRRWPRWAGRVLLLLVAVGAIVGGLIGYAWWEWRREDQTTTRLATVATLRMQERGWPWLRWTAVHVGVWPGVFQRVTEVRFRGDATAEQVSAVGAFRHLESLIASGPGVTDNSFSQITVDRLKALTLERAAITGRSLDRLRRAPNLFELCLARMAVGDADVKRLVGMIPSVGRLDLSFTGVTDAGVGALVTLPGLKELNLAGTRVTDGGLDVLSRYGPIATVDVRHAWTTDAGEARFLAKGGRTVQATPHPDMAALLYSVPIRVTEYQRDRGGPWYEVPDPPGAERPAVDRQATVVPAAVGGNLYFQDGGRVVAIDLVTGKPVTAWERTRAGSGGAFVATPPVPATRPSRFGGSRVLPRLREVTVTADAVLAVIGPFAPSWHSSEWDEEKEEGETLVVCLDRATGALRWQLRRPDVLDAVKTTEPASFVGPVAVAGNVACVRVGGKQHGQKCVVVAVDVRTGQRLWARAPFDVVRESRYAPAGLRVLICADDDRVYAVTREYDAAALDPATGRDVWRARLLAEPLEPEAAAKAANLIGPPASERVARDHGALCVSQGRLFVGIGAVDPIDIVEAATGAVERTAELGGKLVFGSRRDADESWTAVQIDGPTAVVASSHSVVAFRWASSGPRTTRSPGFWSQPQFAGPISVGLAPKWVFASTQTGAVRIDRTSGRAVARYPGGGGNWPSNEGPGNICVTDTHVIIATDRAVNVYGDPDRPR